MTHSKNPTLSIRRRLDLLYENFSREEFLRSDPVGALDRTLSWDDLEALSFILAGLSYGRVENIYRSYANTLAMLETLGIEKNGRGLTVWLEQTPPAEQKKLLSRALRGWVHRLNSANDLRAVIMMIGGVRRKHGSLGHLFVDIPKNSEAGANARETLVTFCAQLDTHSLEFSKAPVRAKDASVWKGTGSSWFYASPAQGSTCKRLVMWMRWMTRKDSIDIGLWSEKFPEHALQRNLFWPVDTHIHQWALREGITARKSVNWAFVEELTAWGKLMSPEDPIRYDFALCQSGMQAFRKKKT